MSVRHLGAFAHIIIIIIAARTIKLFTDLARVDRVVVVRLRNEERRHVRLVSALDRTSPQRAQVEPAVGVDPVHRAVIADENLVGVQLQIGTNKGGCKV